MLSSLNNRIRAAETFEAAIVVILDDMIALLGAEYGNVQLPIGDELAIVAQRGLTASFLRTFRRVNKDDGSACGRALRTRQTVVISDVEKDAAFKTFVQDAKIAGFRAVQSTPFFTSDDLLLGIVSTHFANVHHPTKIELTMMQTYSVVAAEHTYRLLGNRSLAAKAEQMSEALYASMFGVPKTPPSSIGAELT
jgi:GAF domain-containing protein